MYLEYLQTKKKVIFIIYLMFSRRCWSDKEQQDRRKRNSRPNTRLTPFFNAYFVVPPMELSSDTDGIVTDETRHILQTRVQRQKFMDDTMTQAFIRE